VLLVSLYILLGRDSNRRGYFRQWGRAWLALMIGLGVLALHSQLAPAPQEGVRVSRLVNGVTFGSYQLAKLLWCALLVAGTAQYAHRVRRPRLIGVAGGLAVVYAILTGVLADTLAKAIVLQSPIVAVALLYCAGVMMRLPHSRRTPGSRFTGAAFAVNGLLWATYGPMLLWVMSRTATMPPLLAFLASGNSLLDQIWSMALGYGMVVVLLEDEKRAMNAAHDELAVAHDELRRAAMLDPLTGALNRRAFEEGVGLEHARATFGVIGFVDLDGLKTINDLEGHAAGDRMLCRLADAVRGGLRASDKLYRWGGDEFLLVMPGASEEELLRRVGDLLAGAQPTSISASLGAADYEGAEGLERAIAVADAAMYEEKKRRKLSSLTRGQVQVVAQA
jgi:diguanylate cyclase (GGDEF)-like protein